MCDFFPTYMILTHFKNDWCVFRGGCFKCGLLIKTYLMFFLEKPLQFYCFITKKFILSIFKINLSIFSDMFLHVLRHGEFDGSVTFEGGSHVVLYTGSYSE